MTTAPPVATSEEWRTVREFVTQVRLQAHETVVDKSVIQEILGVVDRLGMETVQNMIQHEKRLIGANLTQRFWAEKDWLDEEDFNRADSRGQTQRVPTTYREGGDHGLSQ